jgi:hypothetical protein
VSDGRIIIAFLCSIALGVVIGITFTRTPTACVDPLTPPLSKMQGINQ